MAREWLNSKLLAPLVAFKLEAGTGSAFLTCKLPLLLFGFSHSLYYSPFPKWTDNQLVRSQHYGRSGCSCERIIPQPHRCAELVTLPLPYEPLA